MNGVAQRGHRIRGYNHLFERLLDDLAFLWLLRSQAVEQPNYCRQDICALDQRIQRYLYALLRAPEETWELIRPHLDSAEVDYCFVAAMLAFHAPAGGKIEQVFQIAFHHEQVLPGVISAFGFLPASLVLRWTKELLVSREHDKQFFAIAACSVRRVNPQEYLTAIIARPDCRTNERLYTRVLRLIGEMKRVDLLPVAREAMQDDREQVRFWAAWSAALMGEKWPLPVLRPIALQEGSFQGRSLKMLLGTLDNCEARALVEEIARLPNATRTLVQSCAVMGDVGVIPWLIQKMRQPEMNRLAGEAFVSITGVDLEGQHLLLNDHPLETEDTREPTPDYEQHLPCVDADKVAQFWQGICHDWQAGRRHFLGKQVSSQHLRDVFLNGNQRQRQMAAFHFALAEPEQILLNPAAAETAL